MGLVRIDYVLVGPGLRPASASTDCSGIGDHCLVKASVVVAR